MCAACRPGPWGTPLLCGKGCQIGPACATTIKLNIQKTKIMASSPITSWEIDGKMVETVSDFILGGSKITADGDCSHGFKRRLLLGIEKEEKNKPEANSRWEITDKNRKL